MVNILAQHICNMNLDQLVSLSSDRQESPFFLTLEEGKEKKSLQFPE